MRCAWRMRIRILDHAQLGHVRIVRLARESRESTRMNFNAVTTLHGFADAIGRLSLIFLRDSRSFA